MSDATRIALFVATVFVGAFLFSNVLGRFVAARRRRQRVEAFLERYSAYAAGDDEQEEWLIARSMEMQRDAQFVGLGVGFVAPPPMIGGGYQPHSMFTDLFSRQSFTEDVTPELRIEVLQTALHELQSRESRSAWRLIKPWSWIRLSFERLVGFPRYVLRQAGFSKAVTDSSAARLVTVLWSLIVGVAGVGSFVVALLALRK